MPDASDDQLHGEDAADRWDKDDPRRQQDQFAPPSQPCECYCLHCQRVFMSDQMWFQKVVNDPNGFNGFWMCPTNNCDGGGFTFDIFPTDPDHPANAGWHYFEDDEEDFELDDELAPQDDSEESTWDPQEPQYQGADEMDPDIEGEEWKYGLSPGEQKPEPEWMVQAREQREAEERRYDEPDRRPREVDWSDRTDRPAGSMGEDDIPF